MSIIKPKKVTPSDFIACGNCGKLVKEGKEITECPYCGFSLER